MALAHASIVAKTLALYGIMITGSIWEKVVFGKYLFADAFFWEDVLFHARVWRCTRPISCACGQAGMSAAPKLMVLALAAYAAYIVNAGQIPHQAARCTPLSKRRSPGRFAP